MLTILRVADKRYSDTFQLLSNVGRELVEVYPYGVSLELAWIRIRIV